MLKRIRNAEGALAVWKIETRVGSKRVHRHITCTEAEAHRIYSELIDQSARAKLGLSFSIPASTSVSYESAAERYVAELIRAGGNPEFAACVERALTDLRKCCTKPLPSFVRADILNWRRWRMDTKKRQGNQPMRAPSLPSPATVNKEMACISGFFRWCLEQEWIAIHPVRGIPRIKYAEPPPKTMSWTDYNKLADALWGIRPDAALLLEVLAETGARWSEAVNAKVGDVDQDRQTWTGVKKGKKTVELLASPWMLFAAKDRPGAEPLCPGPNGKPWNYFTFRKAVDRASDLAGVKRISPHVLRHARATWDVESGLSVRAVQERLGHSEIATTETYFKSANARRALAGSALAHRNPVTICGEKAVLSNVERCRVMQNNDAIAARNPNEFKALKHKPARPKGLRMRTR